MSSKDRIYQFIDNEKYVNYFCDKYSFLSKRQKKEISDLEIKMNKYISSTAPFTLDDCSFHDFIFSQFKYPIMPSEIECSIDLFGNQENYSYFYVILICLARLKMKGSNSSIILQKIKLILNLCFRNNECEKNICWYMAKVDAEQSGGIPCNVKELTPIELKAHFFTALKKNQLNKAAKILMAYQFKSDENSDKILILNGYENFMNGNYPDAIKELDKIKLGNIDYNPSVWLRMEILSLIGKTEDFISLIDKSNVGFFDYWHLRYCQMELLLNNCDANLSIEDFKHEMSEINSIFDKPIDSNCYSYKVLNLIFSVCDELIGIYDDINTYKTVNTEIIESVKLNNRIHFLENILSIYSEDFEKISENNSLNERKEKLISLCTDIFNNNCAYKIEEDTEFFYLKEYILFLFRCHESSLACLTVTTYLSVIEDGFNKNNQNVIEIITSYCMQKLLDNQNDSLCDKYLPLITNDSFLTKINTEKVYNCLSEKGRLAFASAEWQFSKSQEEDYGWKDAGMLSLAFFRIIEVELNNKISYPLLNSLGIELIESLYNESIIKLENTKKYEEKWNILINSYRKSYKKGESEFMLGELLRLFRNIGSDYDENDELAKILKLKLSTVVLNESGIKAFNKKFFENSINCKTREKFRNPPAHTRYLSYSVACECREFVIKFILDLNTYLNN